MRRITLWSVAFVGIFALLVLLIRAHPSTPNSVFATALATDPTCPQPCWHGIQLGQTTVDEAYDILRADPAAFATIERPYVYFVTWQLVSLPNIKASLVHVASSPNNDVQSISFDLYNTLWSKDSQFTLADAMQLWGTPIGSSLYYCSYGDSNRAMMTVHFAGNIKVTTKALFSNWRGNPIPALVHVRPDVPLAYIQYYADSNRMVGRPSGNWRGFRDRREDSLKFTNFC